MTPGTRSRQETAAQHTADAEELFSLSWQREEGVAEGNEPRLRTEGLHTAHGQKAVGQTQEAPSWGQDDQQRAQTKDQLSLVHKTRHSLGREQLHHRKCVFSFYLNSIANIYYFLGF